MERPFSLSMLNLFRRPSVQGLSPKGVVTMVMGKAGYLAGETVNVALKFDVGIQVPDITIEASIVRKVVYKAPGFSEKHKTTVASELFEIQHGAEWHQINIDLPDYLTPTIADFPLVTVSYQLKLIMKDAKTSIFNACVKQTLPVTIGTFASRDVESLPRYDQSSLPAYDDVADMPAYEEVIVY